jgi:hypothetical protein
MTWGQGHWCWVPKCTDWSKILNKLPTAKLPLLRAEILHAKTMSLTPLAILLSSWVSTDSAWAAEVMTGGGILCGSWCTWCQGWYVMSLICSHCSYCCHARLTAITSIAHWRHIHRSSHVWVGQNTCKPAWKESPVPYSGWRLERWEGMMRQWK